MKKKEFIKINFIKTISICFSFILAVTVNFQTGTYAASENSHVNSVNQSYYPSGNSIPEAFSKQYCLDQLKDFINVSYFEFNNIERYVSYMSLHPEYDIKKDILNVNIGLDKPFYSEISSIDDARSLSVLVNKYNKLPKDFIPLNLMLIPIKYADWEHYATKETVEAFIKMAEKAAEDGIFLKVTSAYRSYITQKEGYDRAIASGRTIEDVDTLNARPGHSEHQTGLTIDIINTDYRNWNEGGIYYNYGVWLKENSYKFGFIVRYPEGMDAITGYHHEAWHLRYLGKNTHGEFLSEDVFSCGLSYDEYYAKYLKNYTKMYLPDEQKISLLQIR